MTQRRPRSKHTELIWIQMEQRTKNQMVRMIVLCGTCECKVIEMKLGDDVFTYNLFSDAGVYGPFDDDQMTEFEFELNADKKKLITTIHIYEKIKCQSIAPKSGDNSNLLGYWYSIHSEWLSSTNKLDATILSVHLCASKLQFESSIPFYWVILHISFFNNDNNLSNQIWFA